MSWLAAAVVALAFGSAVLSVVTGAAGGVILLSGLLLLAPASAVVPVHGVVQTAGCLTRIGAFHRHVRWDIVGRFVVGVVPGALIGTFVIERLLDLNESVVKLIIAVAILLSLFAHKIKIEASPKSLRAFYGVGFATGLLGMVAGSTGPITSQALLLYGVDKEPHVATKSVVQAIGHGIKIPLFGMALGFDFGEWALPILGMTVMTVLGTLVGKRLLDKMSHAHFELGARVLLGIVAIQIAVTEVWTLAS
ncbi:MAG: TSUP family transporter [Sandaracinaceae bacterium]